jgi:hypothetical protein
VVAIIVLGKSIAPRCWWRMIGYSLRTATRWRPAGADREFSFIPGGTWLAWDCCARGQSLILAGAILSDRGQPLAYSRAVDARQGWLLRGARAAERLEPSQPELAALPTTRRPGTGHARRAWSRRVGGASPKRWTRAPALRGGDENRELVQSSARARRHAQSGQRDRGRRCLGAGARARRCACW